MAPPVLNAEDFRSRAMYGLFAYHGCDIKVKHLVVSLSKDHTGRIETYFNNFVKRIRELRPRSKIEYAAAVVNSQHMHILIRVPYLEHSQYFGIWKKVSHGESDQLWIKQISKTEKSRIRLVEYICEQKREHDTLDVKFLFSQSWGDIEKSKQKKTTSKTELTREEYSRRSKQRLKQYKRKGRIAEFKDAE